ncbi:adenosine 3'-phospho 5'-phosphosulfate transporter 2-like [Elysia marginata]|uniref:Adenosine 3'-phospho 5'-phosphosulfate transporter 2 n=1 Tax=Elysia marginata TaxID=1093978 RepID=A0AAV4IJW5_9GAST|nr:adenosine 3'-phospho 5'-phosphosulfate transporter 2-like [Elysia marginata]
MNDGLRQTVSAFSLKTRLPSGKSATINNTVIKMPEDPSGKESREAVHLWCFDLTYIPRTWQFIILTTLTFAFYLVYGYMQELIFRLEGFKTFGWYLTLIQFFYYTIFGITELQFMEDKQRRIPLKMYLLLAFLTVATMGLSNTSVGYLNYPTQVIFKCCKLIPVLVGGILIQGITLISLALCADGAIGNVQEKTLKQFSASSGEMVLYSYGIGFVYIFLGLSVSGNLIPAFQFCQQHPVETYGYAVIFSITGYLGLYVVLTLVRSFGALVAVTVTTCRKAVTIILSFLFFTKPFTLQYVWSGLVVVLGIYLNLYSKNKTAWDAAIERMVDRLRGRRQRVMGTENIV